MTTVLGYVRVSTEEQAKNGLSLDSQRHRIEAYAKSQDWNLLAIYTDDGYSGKDIDRPALQQLLARIEAGGIDAVLVYRVDRLTRRQRDLWTLLEDNLERNNVGFKSVSEPFDTTTATGKAFLSMIGTFAQLERDIIIERTRDTLSDKKANGEWTGRIPYGYRIGKDGKLAKDPKQQRTIERIRRLRRRGRSLRDIARTVGVGKTTVSQVLNGHTRRYNGLAAK